MTRIAITDVQVDNDTRDVRGPGGAVVHRALMGRTVTITAILLADADGNLDMQLLSDAMARGGIVKIDLPPSPGAPAPEVDLRRFGPATVEFPKPVETAGAGSW